MVNCRYLPLGSPDSAHSRYPLPRSTSQGYSPFCLSLRTHVFACAQISRAHRRGAAPCWRVVGADRRARGEASFDETNAKKISERSGAPSCGQHRPYGCLAGPLAGRSPRAARSASTCAFARWRLRCPPRRSESPRQMSPACRFRVVRSDISCDTAGVSPAVSHVFACMARWGRYAAY